MVPFLAEILYQNIETELVNDVSLYSLAAYLGKTTQNEALPWLQGIMAYGQKFVLHAFAHAKGQVESGWRGAEPMTFLKHRGQKIRASLLDEARWNLR